jgi:hypothetical protein
MNTDPNNPEPITDFKGRSISFYHPNSKGSGSALRLEPRLNRDDSDRYNCFFIELAGQKSTAIRDHNETTPATFDWSKKITVKLGFLDIAEMLTVLEGRAEKIGGERNGLYHASGGGNTMISLLHNKEQGTYYFSLSCKRNKDAPVHKIGITLSEVEATGLRCLFQTGLFFVTFSSILRSSANFRMTNREAA